MKKIKCGMMVFLCIAMMGFAAENDGTKRFGVFIGSNNGGRGRVQLRYAVSDARSMSKVFADMGGIAKEDSLLLVEPSARDITACIDTLQAKVAKSKGDYKRTEIVFYYSGHADDDGLLLKAEQYGYKELRERINAIPSDMRIVILDSCSSGAFTRIKGGVKTLPFLLDSSLSAEGYAFLTSSSANETSQESDAIESSYFTHSLIAGLRGAADMVGDGRVTLNEAYRFAYAETLSSTETSEYGAQHPSYDMQVNGTGDVVLTDIKQTSASLVIDAGLSGRLSIRDASDYLIAEITKTAGRPVELGLESGLYRITLQHSDAFFKAEIQLEKNKRTPLAQKDFAPTGTSPARARGDENANESEDTSEVPFSIQFVPSIGIPFGEGASNNNVLIGIIGAEGRNLQGIGMSGIWLDNSGTMEGIQMSGIFSRVGKNATGIQMSGIFNTAGADMRGIQMAGIFNTIAGDMEGIQMAGIMNISNGNTSGVQAALFNDNNGDSGYLLQFGMVNVSQNENTLPIGVVNVIKNGILNPAISYDDMGYINLTFRSGSKYFYSILSVGGQRLKIGELNIGGDKDKELLVSRGGFGVELPIGNRIFLDFDVISGSIINFNTFRELKKAAEGNYDKDAFDASITLITQARLTAGFKIFKHLSIIGGASYDYLYRFDTDTSPNPRNNGYTFDWSNERNIHKLGWFMGVQF